jgi:hypothetical protein
MKRIAPGLCLALVFFILSCSDSPPKMGSVQWQVVLFRNRLLNTTYQKLSLFVAASDKDGQKDLAFLHVIHDEEELYWSLPAEKWEKAIIRNNEWVGSNGLTMPSGQTLPIGTYRVVLEDLSGKKVESQIYLKKPNVETTNARFPEVRVLEKKMIVDGNFTNPEIWVYDSNDQFLARLPVSNTSIEIASIVARNKEQLEAGFTYYVYAKQSDVYYAVMSGPYYYTPR